MQTRHGNAALSSRRMRAAPPLELLLVDEDPDNTLRMERQLFAHQPTMKTLRTHGRLSPVPPPPSHVSAPAAAPVAAPVTPPAPEPHVPEAPPVDPALQSGIRHVRVDSMALNKLVVSAYKVAGFVILSVILFGLASYLAINVYYFLSSSWIVPTKLSPTDDRVLQLDALASQQEAAKGNLVTRKLELESQLKAAHRIIDTELAFQEGFRSAMATDLSDRKTELARLRALLGTYAASKRSIVKSNEAYAGMSRENLDGQFRAHVIDQEQMLTGNYQIAQIAGANLGLDEKNVEIDSRVSSLWREVASLESAREAAASGRRGGTQLSYDILHIKHDFDASVLASAKAGDDAEALEQSVDMLDAIIARHEHLIATISRSPYVLAPTGA